MSDRTRRQFLGAAAALASLSGAEVDEIAAVPDGGTEGETVPAEVVNGPPGERWAVDGVIAADVWGEELQEAKIELTESEPDLERAAELLREGARRLEERDIEAAVERTAPAVE